MFRYFLLILLLNPVFIFSQTDLSQFGKINTEDVTIARDEWGIPHIHGKMDKDAAYGLAWAHAEDDFESIQDVYLISKGLYGQEKGIDGAIADYAVSWFKLRELVLDKWDTDVSDYFKEYIAAYCQGLNAYAEKHPDEVRSKKLFPIAPVDVLVGHTISIALMSGVDRTLKKIYSGEIKEDIVDDLETDNGSNAFAFSKNVMQDGRIHLLINAHQPIVGPVSFYEAHMISDEGMNIHGGTFPGAMSILHGVNEHLGWAHTSNAYDKLDVYQLEMHPKKKNLYKFDGEWLELEKFRVRLKVKGIPIKIGRRAYWSIYGPTMVTKHGVFALRMPGIMTIQAAEQWYNMGKSKNFEEFQNALEMRGISIMNIIYADEEDNIMYLCNGLVPERDPKFNWKKVLPGNTSETLWEKMIALEEHPHKINPECGYVFNVNNTPFNCTCEDENPDRDNFPEIGGWKQLDNNRSIRLMEMIGEESNFGFEDLQRYKYDLQLPQESNFMEMVHQAQGLDRNEFPDLNSTLDVFSKWNGSMDSKSEGASIFMLFILDLFEKKGLRTDGFRMKWNIADAELAESLRFARDHLMQHFGTISLPYGELLIHRRGDKSYPMCGFPDVMASMMGLPEEDGTFTAIRGEGLIMWVSFGEEGLKFYSINAYGSSHKPDSPHYNDQMELFIQHRTKEMSLNWEEIRDNSERVYNPK